MEKMSLEVSAWLLAVFFSVGAARCVAQEPTEPPSSPLWIADRDAWRALPITERHAQRQSWARSEFSWVEAAAKRPWRTMSSRHFIVLTNSTPKFSKAATAAANDFFDWCVDHFDGVTDELVRRRLLRVVEDEDPDAYVSMTGKGSFRGLELDHDRVLETRRDKQHGNSGEQFAAMFRSALDIYLMEKDPLLFRYMPAWLATGLGDVAGTAYVKAKKLLFRAGASERDSLRAAAREDRDLGLRQVLALDEEAFTAALADREGRRYSMTKAARFFLLGPGAKQRRTKGFLIDYMRAVVTAVEELRGDWDEEQLAEPDDLAEDADEDALEAYAKQSKARRKEFTRRRDEVTARAFEIVCAEWSEKDWRAVEKQFAKYEVK